MLGCGCGFLHNRLHMPIRSADDPSKAARIGGDNGQHGDRAGVILLGFHEARKGLGAQERHVGISDQHQIGLASQGCLGLLDGVPGAQRSVLEHTYGVIPQEGAQGLAIPANDNHGLLSTGSAGNRQSIGQHGFSADRVKHFQKLGLHADSLASGQKYSSDFHEQLLQEWNGK